MESGAIPHLKQHKLLILLILKHTQIIIDIKFLFYRIELNSLNPSTANLESLIELILKIIYYNI